MGNLAADAKVVRLESGFAIVEFVVAVDNRVKHGGEWLDETSFFPVKAFGKYAESLAPYLLKGQQVGVTGRGKVDRWETNGEKYSRVVIEASTVQFVGPRRHQNTENPGNERLPNDYGQAPF